MNWNQSNLWRRSSLIVLLASLFFLTSQALSVASPAIHFGPKNGSSYHNPDSGRFWTQDSYECNGSDPASLHKYTYAVNNPVNCYDPSGHVTLPEISISQAIGLYSTSINIWSASNNFRQGNYLQGSIDLGFAALGAGGLFLPPGGASFALAGGGSVAISGVEVANLAKALIGFSAVRGALTIVDLITMMSTGSAGKLANDKGTRREEEVARITEGKRSGLDIDHPPYGSTDIDVIAGNGDLISVGGLAKANKLDNFSRELNILLIEAQQRGVKVWAYLVEGTPQNVIDRAKQLLGVDKVVTFPEPPLPPSPTPPPPTAP